jgi:hypothetical protein
MENRKLVIIIISATTMIVGVIPMFYFGNEIDKGTYESINLFYMLASQAVCGVGLIGLLVGLGLKNSILEEPSV